MTSTPGMPPFASTDSLATAIADSVRARRNGLDGRIVGEGLEATPSDCNEAAQELGWDRDPASSDMDRPINANIVAADMTGGQP